MPTELASEMAIYDAQEEERRANAARHIADFVNNQPGQRKVLSSSKEGSDSRRGEDPASAAVEDDNSQKRSEFSKQWKSIKFPRREVEDLLKQEPVSL